MRGFVGQTYNFTFTNSPQSVLLQRGAYRFECWGASGYVSSYPIEEGGCVDSLGRGGYTSGYIHITEKTKFFIYVGQVGQNGLTFNSNTEQELQSGGGASDIRLVGGDWHDFNSLKSRIIVAGAGGATERDCGGDGGGLFGTSNSVNQYNNINGQGGKQTSGGSPGSNPTHGIGKPGEFGKGGSGYSISDAGPNGGAGYYGGDGTTHAGSGGGGSSFISGFPGCDAINKESTFRNITHSHQPIHYSKMVFYKSFMKKGNEGMFNPSGSMVVGNSGNGYVRITTILLTNLHLSCKNIMFPGIGAQILASVLVYTI